MYETEQQTTTPAAPAESSGQEQQSRGMAVWSKPSSDSVPNQTERHSQQETTTQKPTESAPTGQQSQVDQLAQRADVQAQAERQGIDVKELAQNIVQAQMEASRQMEASKPQEYTEDQFRKDFGVVTVDAPQFEALFGIEADEQRVAAFNDLLKRTAAMAVKMSQFYNQQELAQVRQQLTPLQGAMRKVEDQAISRRFATKYPDLVKHSDFVTSVLARMKQAGQKFKSVDEAMEAAAKQSRAMLQKAGVQLSSPPQQQKQPAQRQPSGKQPATLSMGGSVGAGKSTSSTQSRGINVLKRSMSR